jgi:hypothetical protein
MENIKLFERKKHTLLGIAKKKNGISQLWTLLKFLPITQDQESIRVL